MRGDDLRASALLALACLAAACSGSSSSTTVNDTEPASTAGSQLGTSGAVADYDGDGVADLLVGAPYATRGQDVGAVLVYRGTAAGFEEAPAYTLTGGDNFGSAVAAAGDVDGDGLEDWAAAAVNGSGADAALSGTVTVFKAGARGKVLATLSGERALDKFGASITGRCDLNHDGHPDLVVGATHHSPAPDRWLGGAVYVYFGPGFSPSARVKLGATQTKGILGFSSACGDLNADGVDDLAVSAIWTHGVIWHDSKILVYYGAPGFAPRTDAPDVTVGSTASHFGDALAILPDLNADGFGELAIGIPALYALPAPTLANPMPSLKGRVVLVKGGAGARTVSVAAGSADVLTSVYGGEYLERFGAVVTALGDLDGDGLPDLAVSSPHANAAGATSLDTGWTTGAVRVFLGKDLAKDGSATPSTAGRMLSRAGRNLHYGSFTVPFDRSGPKLAVGAPTANQQTGTVFVEDVAPAAP
jgi:hypothetical protein